MAKFSDRMGYTQAPKEFQIESMNDELRNSLWNWLYETIAVDRIKSIATLKKDYFKIPIDSDFFNEDSLDEIKGRFMSNKWYEPYNIIEFTFQSIVSYLHSLNKLRLENVAIRLNKILERELSGYRMVEGLLVRITDEEEVKSIRNAMSEPASSGMDGASQHIKKALSLLGKKPEPDYANSIKESISAVESVCKLITGEKSGGLDKALAKLDAQVSFHAGLKKGFLSLYGYTSDQDGIRHAILEQKDIGFAEAKYMLVTCSAFVNFVLEKARQAKLL
jgi:hypothetical protein